MWQQQVPKAKHFSHAKPSSHGIGHGKQSSQQISLSVSRSPSLAPYPSLSDPHTQFNEAALKCLLYSIEFLLIGGLEGQRWQHYLVILSFYMSCTHREYLCFLMVFKVSNVLLIGMWNIIWKKKRATWFSRRKP